ncbi:MAG: sarcosine oxidase subunit alpha [Arenicella sp.]|jgi:sarcosine oxidase subunit alpha
MNRVADGGRIDRTKPISFSFDGKQYNGCHGDTIASALLANGVRLIGRSWKYHRPRGIVGDGAEEPNGLFQVEQGALTIPNVRGTQAQIYQGMVFNSTNAWPSVKFDMMSVFGAFSRFLPAGFYYKTFMWPKKFWMTYEHIIRQASGLGESPKKNDPDYYQKTNAHCDVLVVGSGPSGLMAALAAGRAGARVMIADEQEELGGRLLSSSASIDSTTAALWVAGAMAELGSMADVTIMPRSTVFGYHDANFLTIAERLTDHLALSDRVGARERVWRVRAKHVILATGAHERPIVFANNDRPGVMLASAASTYANRYGIKLADKAVVFTNNDSAYQTADDLRKSGVNDVTLVDSRAERVDLAEPLTAVGIKVINGYAVVNVIGKAKVIAAEIRNISADGKSISGKTQRLDCDLVVTAGGWNPAIHLFSQSGGKAAWNDDKSCFETGVVVQQQISVGSANASFALADCLAEGAAAGISAAKSVGFDAPEISVASTHVLEGIALEPLWRVPTDGLPSRGPKAFVDPQNDVGVADIYLAAREGFESIEHVKRYTALGFGTDQGKMGNISGMAILSEALGNKISDTGTTTFRPNYTPVTFGAIAGPEIGPTLSDPVRKTSIHTWHQENGALFEDVGQWKRPWYFPIGNETLDQAVDRECLAVRNSVGIIDASTLGKIEISGKDSGDFLNMMYTNAWKKLGIDCARYGFMLGEDGMVMDDGVTIRLAENRYFMHTTTGGAASVMGWMELWLQTEWPELEVYLTSVTDHWATSAVVGPNSRKVVSAVVEGIDFDKEAFPFMASRQGTIAGLPVRVNRISFSGELCYEVNVNANHGRFIWEQLMAAGKPYDITPYGTETMHVLRAEKGYVIVGQDTDGSVTPIDLGMGWAVSKAKDFLGKRSLNRVDTVRQDRKQLVGLLTEDPQEVLQEGAQIVNQASDQIPLPMHGHVTSSYHSACAGRSIALALVKNGFKRQGETVYVTTVDGRFVAAKICSTVFIDPQGEKQNV